MTQNTTSHVQQFAQAYAGLAEAYMEHVGRMQAHAIGQAQVAIEESARLAKATLTYTTQLGEGLLKATREAAR